HDHLRSFPTRRSSDLLTRGPVHLGAHVGRAQIEAEVDRMQAVADRADVFRIVEWNVSHDCTSPNKGRIHPGTSRASPRPSLSAGDRKSTRLNSSHVKI